MPVYAARRAFVWPILCKSSPNIKTYTNFKYIMRKRIGYFLRLLRQFWLRQKGMYIGRGCEIRKKVFFDNASRVSIGHYSFVNRGCEFHIGAGKTNRIVLGNNVYVGMNVCFICVSHELGSPKKRAGVNKYGDIS